MYSHLIRHIRLAWCIALSWTLAAAAPAASPATPKPLPRYKHYYPDAQYHLAKSDDRPVPGLDPDQYCVQKSPDGYDLAFIEFDQRGDFWERDQLAIARHQLKSRLKPGEKPLLIEYVHGWHHNAQEDEHRDVKGFRALLSFLSHSQYLKDHHYHVFGVYMGWRGEQWRSGGDPIGYAAWLPSQLSFYPEKHIGSLVGSMPMVTEALFWMVNTARDASPDGARTVLIGHSFGAMVLENAIAQAVASGSAMNPGKGAPVAAPADLILLLNSAADSLHAKGVTEMLDRMGKAGASRFVDAKHPLIISVTSTGDWATGKFFPLGTGLSNLTKFFRPYESIGKDKKKLPEGTTQRDFVTTTPGHNDLLLSHLVHVDANRIAPSTRKNAEPPAKMTSGSVFEQNISNPLQPQNSGAGMVWPFRSIAKDGTACRSEISFAPDARMRTAYWIMRVPPQIIYDHGDIFNEQALCLYAALFRIENPTKEKLPAGPRKLQMAPPVIHSAASGGTSTTKTPN